LHEQLRRKLFRIGGGFEGAKQRKRVKGEWTYADLGKNFYLVEDKDMNILYSGYAIKK